MGITLPHEHIFISHASVKHNRNNAGAVDLTDPDLASREVALFAEAGGRTIIEMSNIGIRRDPIGLRRLSEKTGVNIVMGAGYYKDEWLPPEVDNMSVEDLARQMVNDVEVGVDGTGLRAGVIGELGMSQPRTATETNMLRAAARAQRRTGVAISLHFDVNSPPDAYLGALDVLASENADLARVAVGHQFPRKANLEIIRQIAQRGPYVQFDLFGTEAFLGPKGWGAPLDEQLAIIKVCLEAGLVRQMLISQDVCHQKQLAQNGGGGYAHILKDLVPRFKQVGVTDQDLHIIMQENPQRLFPVRRYHS
jgi:phosphotriesterase-related protein